MKKLIKPCLVSALCVSLSGCYYPAPVAYAPPQPVYQPGYYAAQPYYAAPAYYPPPSYYGPTVVVGGRFRR